LGHEIRIAQDASRAESIGILVGVEVLLSAFLKPANTHYRFFSKKGLI
jgi:hypothetical protein